MFRNSRQHHRLVGRCDRIVRGSREQRGFFVGDIVERAETFAMFEIDVEDHRDVGLDDLRELRNFAARVGAAFEHGRAMLAGECENRHRHADQIVEIAGRRERRSEDARDDGGGQFLGGGLADRAADRDQRKCASCASPHEVAIARAGRVRRACRRPRCNRERDDDGRSRRSRRPRRALRPAADSRGRPKLSPRSATNSAPAEIERVSMLTPRMAIGESPATSAPPIASTTSASVNSH